jgi:transposase
VRTCILCLPGPVSAHRHDLQSWRSAALTCTPIPEEPVKRWLTTHPRFVLHFTPTSSSWLNLVERWFAELTTKKLRRGTHTSVRQLNADIRAWIQTWNDNPRPYVWTKTADQILTSIGNYCTRINDSGH